MNNQTLSFYKRTSAIPDTFPLEHYCLPTDTTTTEQIVVGIDSGVSNCAFCELQLIYEDGYFADFEIKNLYYFEDEIKKYTCIDDRYYFLASKYYDLFSKKPVCNTIFELLSLNTIKDNETLKGVLRAQKTTHIISFICRCLKHPYTAISPKAIKYALTGNGNATKEEMQKAAYEITDEQFLEFLENDHLADAFAMAFYYWTTKVKEEMNTFHLSPPPKYAHMDWLWQ